MRVIILVIIMLEGLHGEDIRALGGEHVDVGHVVGVDVVVVGDILIFLNTTNMIAGDSMTLLQENSIVMCIRDTLKV